MDRPATDAQLRRSKKSLHKKFVRTLLLVAGIIGLSTLVTVGVMSAQDSAEHLRAVQQYIEEGIASKGSVLARNHALALRGLSQDNAFLDMQRLLERAIKEDPELVYGVYVSAEHETLAMARRPLAEAEATPARDAWRSLGLSASDVLLKDARVERKHRLGQDLLEVAAPVLDEDGELLGTVRYGLSTKRMRDALASARADASARLRRSLELLGLLVSLAMVAGVLVSRREARRITRPISDLTRAAGLLALGDCDVRVDIHSQDELELLGASFNRMVEELGASYRSLEDMNRTLEQKVAARTVELADMNRDMRLVLDNVDQGFVTLSPDGVMAHARSRQVGAWFGEAEGSRSFWHYLEGVSPEFATAFELAWSQIAEDFLPLGVCLAQLPERLTSAGRTFSLRYLPFFREGKLDGVLVALTDISERLAREREDAEHAELMQAFKRLVQDRGDFEVFLGEAAAMVASIAGHELDDTPVLLKRALHTLKGTCGSMGLTVIAQICHALESELVENERIAPARVAELEARWRAVLEHLTSSGLRTQRLVEIPEKEYAELVTLVSEGATSRWELGLRLAAWQAEPVEKAFGRLAHQGIELARRSGKGALRVVVDAGGVRLDRGRFGAFWSELVHIVRNAVDHGIEAPEERAARGKPREGTLSLRASSEKNELRIEIADDGAGIDWEAIRAAASERGLPHRTEAELFGALCRDGLTTRSEVTSVSGRGVGMAAVLSRVRSMHGVLEVESTLGRGTTWIIRFPAAAESVTGSRSGVFPPRAAVQSALERSEPG
jgi:two-component system chemotaxis sensor kinase CheA